MKKPSIVNCQICCTPVLWTMPRVRIDDIWCDECRAFMVRRHEVERRRQVVSGIFGAAVVAFFFWFALSFFV